MERTGTNIEMSEFYRRKISGFGKSYTDVSEMAEQNSSISFALEFGHIYSKVTRI